MPNFSLTISSAFDLLRDEVDARLAKFHQEISVAAGEQAYDEVGKLAKAAQEVTDLKRDLAALEKRFGALVEADPAPNAVSQGTSAKKFKKGLKTPETAYQRPILRALVELGGSSELHAVLNKVYDAMKGQLNEHDLSALPSDGITPRWKNTAQWARNALREGGYIKDGSPVGIWEISEKGRAWLAEQPKPEGKPTNQFSHNTSSRSIR